MANIGGFPSAFYNPRDIEEALKDPTMRKLLLHDYSQMRSTANKRLEKFKGTEWEDSKQYRYNAGRYKKLSDIKSDSELAHLLTDVQKFTASKTSTVSGLKNQRSKMLESLHEAGYTGINKNNIKAFGEFMEETRAKKIAHFLDSDKRVELFKMAEKKGVSAKTLMAGLSDFVSKSVEGGNVEDLAKMSSKQLWRELNVEDNNGGDGFHIKAGGKRW